LTVLFVVHDENGGFFDHVPPVAAPFSRGGYVCSGTFDHTSLLRFIEKRSGWRYPTFRPGGAA